MIMYIQLRRRRKQQLAVQLAAAHMYMDPGGFQRPSDLVPLPQHPAMVRTACECTGFSAACS